MKEGTDREGGSDCAVSSAGHIPIPDIDADMGSTSVYAGMDDFNSKYFVEGPRGVTARARL